MVEPNPVTGIIAQLLKIYGQGASRTSIHKILFKLQLNLPEDNAIKNSLPFYWYRFGPYSEEVDKTLTSLMNLGILEELVTSNEKKVLHLCKDVVCPDDEYYEEAISSLKEILKGVNLYRFKPFIEKIYVEDAPSKLYPLFKLRFMEGVDGYLEQMNSDQMTLSMFSTDSNELESLENILYECEIHLPSDPLYDSFNDSFSSFVTCCSRTFDYIDHERDATLLDQLRSISEGMIWNTFAAGMRILYHDEHYRINIPRWIRDFELQYSWCNRGIESFNDGVLPIIRSGGFLTSRYTDKSKRILSSVVNGYLSDG